MKPEAAMRGAAPRHFPVLWRLFAVFLAAIAVSAAAQTPEREAPRLRGFTNIPRLTLVESEPETRWLAQHPTLNIGVVPNELVPFDLLGIDNEYEGISADVAEAVVGSLRVQPNIKVFRTRDEAAAALESGAVDLLPTVTAVDAKPFMSLSAPYVTARYVEVSALERRIDRASELTVGYIEGHASVEALRRAYPKAKIVPYGTVFLGVTGAINKKVDVFVGNGASVSYLVEHFQLSNIRVTAFSEAPPVTIHFAVRTGDAVLLELVNRTLAALTPRVRSDIKARWAPAYEAPDTPAAVNFSESERQWLATHPVVRYATVDDSMPFMFLDHSGRYAGLTFQIMDKIAAESGLVFEPVPGGRKTPDSADIAPVVFKGVVPSPAMVASDPYFRDHWVIVARSNEADFPRIENLTGKRVAYLPPNALAETIKRKVPSVKLVEAESVAETFGMVANGSADVTIANINTANYIITQSYADRLKVAGAIDDAPVDVAFGVRADKPELLSIINKTIENIPPEEMRRVRSNGMFFSRPTTDWKSYAEWMYAFGAGLILCLVMFAMWNRSLKSEVRRRLVAEDELRDQLNFQRAMLEGIPFAVCVRDAQARLIFCNSAFEKMFVVSRYAVMGKTLPESNVTHASDAQMSDIHDQYLRLLQDGAPISEDLDVSLGGLPKRIIHWAAPITLEEGGVRVAFVTGAIDVTERHHLVELIESARAKAEAANRAKSNFLATMSHEIRTPMNAVMGMLELLVREGRLTPEDRESAKIARTSAQALLGLIDDILDISKIEAGGLEVVPRPAQLRPIIEEVANVFESMARQRGLRIKVEIDERLAQWHAVDAPRFRQIVNNLVSNAIKYSDSGVIMIRLSHLSSVDDLESIELEVRDNGIGIAPEDVRNLFKPFFQAESAGPRVIGGTGLGLPIVQRLCMKMGGDISVSSQRGVGTSILVALKLMMLPAPAPEALLPAAADRATAGNLEKRSKIRILVVDDHPANRMLLQRQLSFLGFQSETAQDGRVALDMWGDEHFDVVITDCSMPVMDGYEFTKALRSHERERGLQRCPVLGCTAHVQEHDRRRALDVGMDECLMKPVSVDGLLEAIRRHLPAEAPVELVEAPVAPSKLVPAPPREPFDAATLRGFSGGDPKIEASFLDALLRTNITDLEELSGLVQTGAIGDVPSCAHKIKGAARIVKAERVVEDCEAVEDAGKRGDTAALAQSFGALQRSLAEFNDALSARLQVNAPLAH